MNKINIFGMILGIATIVLGCFLVGWKIPLIVFLSIYANNMERNGRK